MARLRKRGYMARLRKRDNMARLRKRDEREYLLAVMSATLSIGVAALAAQVPALALVVRGGADERARSEPSAAFWAVLALAGAGAVWVVSQQLMGGWRGGLAPTLWVSVAATFAVFAACTAAWRETARLAPLVFPYMALLSALAQVISVSEHDAAAAQPIVDTVLAVHIGVSVATYAVATLAAIAAFAAFLQERALKAKAPRGFAQRLTPLAVADALTQRLLLVGEAVLGLGIATGIVEAVGTGGLHFDHKTLLSILAFVVIGAVLWAHHRFGLRGRRAARGVLLAYLLLTLGYPGVKFVRDVLIGG
jgi:ABC-type uncharacterized transport system permease subunit